MIENQKAGVTQKKKKYGRLKDFICFFVAAFISFSQVSLIWAAEGTRVFDEAGLFSAEEAGRLSAENLAIIREISERTAYIKEHVDAMVEARKVANKIEGERAKAVAYHDTIAPMLEQIRYHIDKLELIVDDQMWTLPKYRELLFIR